jgi:crossover junction endodeoxyribonuclease RuvC
MIVGVDPGKTGAVALLDSTGQLVTVADMPVIWKIVSPALLAEIVHNWIDPFTDPPYGTAVIEDVHAMPKQGVSSVFSFGRALGVTEGVLAAEGFAITYVSPAKWKRTLGLSSDKGASRRRATELWPDMAGSFKRVKDDGRAEAALIAYWWWRTQHDGAR